MCGMASASRTISTGPRQPRDHDRAVDRRQRSPRVQIGRGQRHRGEGDEEDECFQHSAAHVRILLLSKYKLASADLKPVLDRLYTEFNYPDSAADPIHIVRRYHRADDREVVAFCAAALAFGRVASVLQSIERLLDIIGAEPAAYVRGFDPFRQRKAFADFVHRWTRGPDLVALLWILKQMFDRSGSIEGFFLEGFDPAAPDVTAALDSFSARALALDVTAAYGPPAGGRERGKGRRTGGAKRRVGPPRRLLLLPARLGRQRMQTAEPVHALDGASRRARSGRVVAGGAGQADRAAGHTRDSCRPLSRAHPLHQPGLAHGARYHRVAAPARSGRSRQVRFLALPPGDDERLRIQSCAG